MRLPAAWAKTAMQNVTLKWATVTLALSTLFLTFGLLRLALRDPVLIERTCFTQSLKLSASLEPTNDEIKAFIKEVLPSRFDTEPESKIKEIALGEQNNRFKEQELLKQKQMSQKILVGRIQIQNSEITVEADRVLSIGKAKTILPFPVKVEIQKTTRSESNPYGLILTNVSSLKKEGALN